MKFSKRHISDLPLEKAHGGSGSRHVLLDESLPISGKWEAVNQGFIPVGGKFDWHKHNNSDEMFLVTKGNGKFYCENEETDYKTGDVILVEANTEHKIENTGSEVTEGFFIRVKA